MNRIEEQARYYRNIPLRDRSIRAVVHLEDSDDKAFWNNQLQNVLPANYHYVTYSKSDNDNDTSGCEQCLRYKDYLNRHFFICIDSDLRLLCQESGLTPRDLVAQTYAYSWENHHCEGVSLQQRVIDRVGDTGFDFEIFLRELSQIVYRPMLYLVYYKTQNKSTSWNIKMFNMCIPLRPSRELLLNNGKKYLDSVKQNFDEATSSLVLPGNYMLPGLTEDNTYLHIQGHQLHKLVTHIGTRFCGGKRVAFRSDVLDVASHTSGYPEIDAVHADLEQILL